MKSRYGRYNFKNNRGIWFGALGMLLFGMLGYLNDLPLYVSLGYIGVAICGIVFSLLPYREYFSINENQLVIKRGRKMKEISIPQELLLIISDADVKPRIWAMRTENTRQTVLLKGQYFISILKKMPIELAVEKLHYNYAKSYTNTRIEDHFPEYMMIYSFIYDERSFEQLVYKRDVIVIIPESLENKIIFGHRPENLYIDKGY